MDTASFSFSCYIYFFLFSFFLRALKFKSPTIHPPGFFIGDVHTRVFPKKWERSGYNFRLSTPSQIRVIEGLADRTWSEDGL